MLDLVLMVVVLGTAAVAIAVDVTVVLGWLRRSIPRETLNATFNVKDHVTIEV